MQSAWPGRQGEAHGNMSTKTCMVLNTAFVGAARLTYDSKDTQTNEAQED